MTLASGTRVGVYEVIGLVGAGGMGEVYRALDTRLKRDVALKVLPASLAGEADRLLRFAREAEMLAALNHPNIAAIYGVEDAESANPAEAGHHVRALVMELVEGETLAEQIARGPIPLTDALAIARQIAVALEAAHEQGIVHRDLKPANVKLRDDGTVKVLDFGLAKLADPIGAAAGSSSMSLSPTITSPALMTNAGMLLGTAAYMSPEQAKGRPADKRSDMWAFGCVLFEMLTGERAFEGEDVSETLAAVLRGEPEWAVLPAETPPAIRALIRRCLERDRRKRVADSAAALFALDEHANLVAAAPAVNRTAVEEELKTATEGVRRDLNRRARRQLAAAGAAAVLLAAAAVATTWYAMRPPPAPVTKLALAPIDAAPAGLGANNNDIAITSDGTRVVYFTDPAAGGPTRSFLAVRALNQLDAMPLRLTRAFGPFLRPDNSWVGFYEQDNRALKKISILGGADVLIASNVAPLRGATWGTDDTIIFGTSEVGDGLWRVPAGGGTPSVLTKIGTKKAESHVWPHLLPGGRAVLFTILPGTADAAQIALLDLETGKWSSIIPRGTYARYSPSGHIVYAVGSALFAVGFDLDRLAVTTDPMPTGVDGVVVKETGAADFDIASNGTLVYVPGSSVDSSRRVMFVTRTGEQTPVPNLEPGNYRSVRVNRDGTEIAFETAQSGDGNLWTYDVARAARNALTTGDADDKNPLWHPTEKRILFGSNRDGRLGLFAVNADGSGAIERLMSDDKATDIFPYSFSRDARTVLFSVYRGGTAADIGMFALGGGAVDNRMQTEVNEGFPAVSPDGQWLAYASTRTGSAQVYVERYPALGDRRSISTGVGLAPVWSRSGRELYYFDPSNQQLMAVDITPGANLVASVPKTLFKVAALQSRTWGTMDVMPDGRFVVIVRNDSDGGTRANPIVMQNWSEELKQRFR